MRYAQGRQLPSGRIIQKVAIATYILASIVPGLYFFDHVLASAPYNASDLIGQTDSSGNVSWGTTDDENRRMPDSGGFGWMSGMQMDRTHHKLYVSESTWNDIVVFNLDPSNQLTNRVPAYILGASPWSNNMSTATTAQNGLSDPEGMALDVTGQRLFVADRGNNRVLEYDVSSLSNNMNAAHVLGQATFTTKTAATSQTGMSGPQAVAYDAVGQRLFVGDDVIGRVLVFSVSSIADGQAAAHVIGKANFTSTAACTTSATNICRAYALAHDDSGQRLFVSDYSARRVLVFSTSSITDGEAATHVLGEPNFTTAGGGSATASTMVFPDQLEYDSTNNRLIVSDFIRVLFFSVSTITNGQAATNELGEPDFTTTAGPIVDQSHMYYSMGTAYDPGNGTLLVADREDYRVLQFNVSTITNGENAANEYGQTDASGNPVWDESTARNRNPNAGGLSAPEHVALDPVGHRLFVSDMFNDRVLVYDLDTSNNLVSRDADAVLGPTDLNTDTSGRTQSLMNWPEALAYDSTHNWLYVSDYWNHRILVFDTAHVTNGENALYVIGQPDFTSSSSGLTATQISSLDVNLAYDNIHNRLLVADQYNDRVLIFYMNNPSNGMAASYVLGQPDFTTDSFVADNSTLSVPYAVAYDPNHNYLYVGDSGNNRILVYDLANIANGMAASYVLGQPDFATYNSPSVNQNSTYSLVDLAFDPATGHLWAADSYNRILMFGTNNLSNGMNASAVLGQPDFNSSSFGYSQSLLGYPTGLAVDSGNQRLYAVDDSGDRVMVYDTIHITTSSLPSSVVGQSYSAAVLTSGSQGSTTLSISSGGLPPGLTMDSSGHIGGTPSNIGTYLFVVTAADNNGVIGSISYSQSYSITITAAPSTPSGGSAAQQTTGASATIAPTTSTVLLNNDPNYTTDVGSTQTMSDGSAVTFTLTDASGSAELHTATVTNVTDSYADVTIASNPIYLQLYVGDMKKIDVNGDGVDDISVKLVGIVSHKAVLVFHTLSDLAKSPASLDNTPENANTHNVTRQSTLLIPLAISGCGVFVLAVAAGFVLHARNRRLGVKD